MSVLLLAGAGLMVRSFLSLSSQRLGYRTADVLSFQTAAPGNRYPAGPAAQELVRGVLREFRSTPGVAAAAATSGVPLMVGWGRSFTVEGAPLLSLKDAAQVAETRSKSVDEISGKAQAKEQKAAVSEAS